MEGAKNNKHRDPHLEDLIDHYWGSVNHIAGLIKASELKAGLILSFYGILLNFIYQSAGNWIRSSVSDTTLYVLLSLWIGATVISIFFCVRCFMPRIEESYDDNILFFGDIISKFGTIKEFSRTFYKVSINEEELFQQMGEQIYINAKIAHWKFENVKKAIRFLAVSLIVLIILVIYYSIFFLGNS
jgi:hypothetical protein